MVIQERPMNQYIMVTAKKLDITLWNRTHDTIWVVNFIQVFKRSIKIEMISLIGGQPK